MKSKTFNLPSQIVKMDQLFWKVWLLEEISIPRKVQLLKTGEPTKGIWKIIFRNFCFTGKGKSFIIILLLNIASFLN